jgi:erythromycin esterase
VNPLLHVILIVLIASTLCGVLASEDDRPSQQPGGDSESYAEQLNLGFETGDPPTGWYVGGEGYRAEVDSAVKHSGERSLRIEFVEAGQFGVATGRFLHEDVKGGRLRLTGFIKTEAISTGWAGLWMRVDGPGGVLSFDNMQQRGITGTTDWTQYEILLDVPEEAININFGALLTGNGTAWIDSLAFEVLTPAEPPPLVALSGVVRGADGEPVAGAHVALIPPMGRKAAARVVSGDDGRFTVELRAGEYGITATANGHRADYAAPGPIDSETSKEELIVTLGENGFTVSGVVRDDAGKGAANVALQLIRVGEEVADIFYTETDAEGRYSVTLIPAERYLIMLDSEDYISLPSEATAGVDQTVDLDVVRRGPAPDDVVAWVKKHAIPLKSAEAGNGFEEMQPLREVVGKARVVALGEATHGTREFFQLKHRMLEFLVEEMGFTVFAIEANWSESLALNDYVLHGNGDPKEGLAGIYFWTWNTEEVLELIEWMRRYNADPEHERKLKFYGFDMQYSTVAAKAVLAFLREVDPEFAEQSAAVLQPALQERPMQSVAKLEKEDRQALQDGSEQLLARFDARREDWSSKAGEREWVIARQHAVVVQQAVEMYLGTSSFNVRDRSMAANIEWILETEPPGTRVVAWAHNGHVARSSRSGMEPMGMSLDHSLGEDYVVFGFVFNRGSFQAIDWTEGQGKPGGLREHTVGPAPEENIGAAFARTGWPIFAFDLRSREGREPLPKWFDVPHPMREIGAIFLGEETMSNPVKLTGVYDALLFVDETTRAQPVKRGSSDDEGSERGD